MSGKANGTRGKRFLQGDVETSKKLFLEILSDETTGERISYLLTKVNKMFRNERKSQGEGADWSLHMKYPLRES